jgi:hypothetical protein
MLGDTDALTFIRRRIHDRVDMCLDIAGDAIISPHKAKSLSFEYPIQKSGVNIK